jgi:hypothetical protein
VEIGEEDIPGSGLAESEVDRRRPPAMSPVGSGSRRDGSGSPASVRVPRHDGRAPFYFQKFVIFCLNSDGEKLYIKIVGFDEIYNFVVQRFFFEVIFIVN